MQAGLQTFLLWSFPLLSLAYGGWSWSPSWSWSLSLSGKNAYAHAYTLDPTVIYAGLPVGDKPQAAPSSFETGSSTFTPQRLDSGHSHSPLLEVSTRNAWLSGAGDAILSPAGLAGTWQRVCHLATDIYTYVVSSYSSPVDGYPIETKDGPPLNSSDQTVIAKDSQDAAAAGRIPEHARGSCMAVVVSLVVGIMWF